MRNGSRLSVLVVAGIAALAPAASTAGAEPGASSGLCGIVDPLDDLLHCDKQPAGPAASGTESPSAAAAARATPALPVLAPQIVPPTPRYAPNLLMVRFRPGLSPRRQAQVLAEAGVTVDHEIGELGVFVVRMPPGRRDQALARLLSSPWVSGAEKDALVELLDTTPNDPYWFDQWGLRRIGLPVAWEQTKGASVVVAVLDTGVDAGHPDLQGAVLPGSDLTSSSTGASDAQGHGTSVAGIIAARADNHKGIAGICWSCSILPIKVLGDDGQGTMDALAQGIVEAADAGVRVINMSLGGPAGSDTLDQAINYATAKNVILVAGAGNNGSLTPFYPAANPNVISVAGTDERDQLYSWSDYGGWVRVAAPGCNPAPVLGGGYAMFCGTSSATPVVSGLVALALSLRPDVTRGQIIQAITAKTDPLAAIPQGRVNAPATLSAVAPGTALPAGPRISTSTFRGTLTATRTWRIYQRVVGAGPVSARLSFTQGARLTLSLISSSNKILSSVSGRTPLVLNKRLGARAYWFGVATAQHVSARYTLTVTARP